MNRELKSFEAIRKSVENDAENSGFFSPKVKREIIELMDTPRKKKAALNKIVEYCNDVLDNPPGDSEKSLLDYAWCGKLSKAQSFSFEKGRCFIDGMYCDLDECSYVLYTWIAERCNNKIRKNPILNKRIMDFKVAVRGNKGDDSYRFALKVNLSDNESVLLSGDWLINWKYVKSHGLDVGNVHTIKWHTMWPCRQIDGKTINQLRVGIDLQTTLRLLLLCYQNDFEHLKSKDKDSGISAKESLMDGYFRYKDWFLLFGQKEEGYQNYIDFWELDVKSLFL